MNPTYYGLSLMIGYYKSNWQQFSIQHLKFDILILLRVIEYFTSEICWINDYHNVTIIRELPPSKYYKLL